MNNNQNKGGQNRGHLTAKEIARWLVEGPEESAGQHVRDCWACQAKLAEAQGPLNAFRTAVVNWSEAQVAAPLTGRPLAKTSERYLGLRLWLPLAGVALAALLLVGYAKIPGWFHGHSTGPQQAAVTSTSSSDSDAVLMDQVDTEVSEAVPDAMAPLTDLVAWDSGQSSEVQAAATEKLTAHKKPAAGSGARAHVDVAN